MAAPTISSATIGTDGQSLTIVWSEAATWTTDDRLYVIFGDGEGTPLPAHRLHQTNAAPGSGDGTDTHVYTLIGRAFDGETVTVTVPADTVEDGGSVGNALISGASVTNDSEATQGNSLTRVDGQLIAAWAIPDRYPIDRLEDSSPTYKVALKAVDEFSGISQVEFTFSTAVTKTGGSSSTTHTVSSLTWTALTDRVHQEAYWVVEIDVGWTKGTVISVDAEVTLHDGTVVDLSGTLGSRDLYRAKARSSRNIIYVAGNSGTDQTLVQADMENGGDDSKALLTLGRAFKELYLIHGTVQVDEILVQEGTGDSVASYTASEAGGYVGLDTFGRPPHDNVGANVMLYVGPDEDSPPTGDLVLQNDTAQSGSINIAEFVYLHGWTPTLVQVGDSPPGWDVENDHICLHDCDFVYPDSGSAKGSIAASAASIGRGDHFSMLDCTITGGDRAVNIGDSGGGGVPEHIIISGVACSGGGSAMRFGARFSVVEGFTATSMIDPDASPGWAADEHLEFIASNRVTTGGTPSGQAIFSGCFVHDAGGDNLSKEHTYNFMQIRGTSGDNEFNGIAIINCGCYVHAGANQLMRIENCTNVQIVHNTFGTSTNSDNSAVGIAFQDGNTVGNTQELILIKNNVTQNYAWSGTITHEDIAGLVLDGLATDDDYGAQNFDPTDARWNNVTATSGAIETAYDIDNIATGDFEPVAGSSLDELGSPTGIAFDAEGTARGASPDIGAVQVASSGGGSVVPGGAIRNLLFAG